MKWKFDDGGRKDAGYKGRTDDCVVCAIAIATELDYEWVYDQINEVSKKEYRTKRRRTRSSARTGVHKVTYRKMIEERLKWVWTPTMFIGSGCQVHLREDELPGGRLIVSVSKHITAVVDGVVHDTYDPTRGGIRCVYGYWKRP